MAAGIAQLTILKNNPQIYEELNQKSDTFFETMKEKCQKERTCMAGKPCRLNRFPVFTEQQVVDYASAKPQILLSMHGILNICWTMESILHRHSLEAMFVSAAHTEKIWLMH